MKYLQKEHVSLFSHSVFFHYLHKGILNITCKCCAYDSSKNK